MPTVAGETAATPSAWTVDSLGQHLSDLVAEVDKRYEQRFSAQERALDKALDMQEGKVTAAFIAAGKLLEEITLRNQQRFESQEKAIELALARLDKEFHERIRHVRETTKEAMEASDKAVGKSEAANEQRFAAMNEFRAQLSDQAQTFMPRRESEARHNTTAEKMEGLDKRMTESLAVVNSRLDRSAGQGAGANAVVGYIFAAGGFLAAVVAIMFAVSKG